MKNSTLAYGPWTRVVVNSAIFLLFAFNFFKPQTARDWGTFGAFAGFGVYLLCSAWNVLYHAQRRGALATNGAYARIRHPQYVAFVLILLGFLLQWPTLLTLQIISILLLMYGRLAITEEKQMREQFGAEFDAYAARTPRFLPSFKQEASVA